MKKLLVALIAVMAIVLTSCKHDSCTLYVENHYTEKAIVLFSPDEQCGDIEKSEMYALAKPGEMYMMKGVKVKGLYAIIYVCEEVVEKGDETLEGYVRKVSFPLSEYDGFATVTVSINMDGLPSVTGSGL